MKVQVEVMDGKQPQGCTGVTFGERFEFDGHKFIVVSEVANGFVLAVKADDETPAPIFLLSSPQSQRENMGNWHKVRELPGPERDVLVWTSGTCVGDRGAGGWAYVRQDEDGVLAIASGSESDTTMTRMKIRAVIEALKALPQRDSRLVIFADSQSAIRLINDEGPPNADADLRDEMSCATAGLAITWRERGGVGAGLPDNERYSRLAEDAATHQANASPATRRS